MNDVDQAARAVYRHLLGTFHNETPEMDYPDRITLAPPNISWWRALPLPEVRSIGFPRGEFEVDTLGKVAILLERTYVCTRSVVTTDRIVLHVHRLRPAKLSETDVELPIFVRERHAQLGRQLNPQPVWRKHPSGGWVENSARVSRTAAICSSAVATGQSSVLGRAHMFDQTMLAGVAKLYDDASISEQAFVGDRAVVSGRTRVAGLATVCDEARVVAYADVRDRAEISGHAQITDQARVRGSAKVSGWACVFDNAIVEGTASLSGSAYVGGTHVLWGGSFDGNRSPFYVTGSRGPIFQVNESWLGMFRNYRIASELEIIDATTPVGELFVEGPWKDMLAGRQEEYRAYVRLAQQMMNVTSVTRNQENLPRRRLLRQNQEPSP